VGAAELGHRIVAVVRQYALIEGVGLLLAWPGIGDRPSGFRQELVDEQAPQ